MNNVAVFLDRDGVINKPIIKNRKPFAPTTHNEFAIYPEAAACVLKMHSAGFRVIIVTNQKDVGKKIIAQSPEDLQMISACCSEGKVKISDIKYLPSNKIFLISILRKDRENEDKNKIINSIIKFEFVQSTKSKNIDQNEPETELELLAIDLFKREHNFEITLLFSKNRFITLTSEIIEAVLEDQKIENDKSN